MPHILQNKEIQVRAQQKAKKTCIEKYGCTHTSQLKATQQKRLESLKQHGTFVSSKYEEQFYNLLLMKFDSEDILRQYKDTRYPFACDFYIKSLDLFIELNICWTHGGGPFNKNSESCIQQLNQWQKKAKVSKFYVNAIDTWTRRDVIKLEMAKNAQLNYISFYSWDDATIWYNTI